MEKLKKLSYKELGLRRNMFLIALQNSVDEEDRAVYRLAIEGIENEMYRKETATPTVVLVVIVNLIALSSIFLTGCQAVAGAGRDITWTAEAGQEMLRYGHEAKGK